MQQIVSDEEITWENVIYNHGFGPFPYNIFENFDKDFIQGIPRLSDDFIRKILLNNA